LRNKKYFANVLPKFTPRYDDEMRALAIDITKLNFGFRLNQMCAP
jgi:hypothetical protein